MPVMLDFLSALDDAAAAAASQAQRSLVLVQRGRSGFGAGIVWRAQGLILTNNHVIGRRPAWVSLADGTRSEARLVASDPEIDLALLEVEAPGLVEAVIGDSRSLRVGELVMAVGHPWGQPGTVTAGLISGLGQARTNGPRKSVEIIRSDVRLAPGNSGGPLVNARGQVIGVNTMLVGGDLGVAIPMHVVTDFAERALQRAGGMWVERAVV